MEDKFIEQFFKPGEQLEEANTLDAYLDKTIPLVRPWSEDLREEKFFLNKPWIEIRDDENFHSSILHFFNEGGEYLKSIDGNVQEGSWRYLPAANKLLIADGHSEGQLYSLSFLDANFFILNKHGDQKRFGRRKYFVMMYEPIGSRLQWQQVAGFLREQYEDTNNFQLILGIVIAVVIAIILLLSAF